MMILVVENDAGFRGAWVGLLRDFGHTVLVLSGLEGQTAVDIHAQGFDLALIDRRIKDDRDESDTTGQDFALELCKLGTPAILVTAFIPTTIFDLLWTGTLTGIADKSLDMLELAMCVEEFKVSNRFPNCVARFQWKGKADAFTAEDWEKVRNGVAEPGASAEEFAVLFRSVIPPFAQIVELQPIPPGTAEPPYCTPGYPLATDPWLKRLRLSTVI